MSRPRPMARTILHADLKVANENLVIASVTAQAEAEAARKDVERLARQADLDARLMEAQKLETLALLAGGVAHDFNNLLTSILGYVDMARLAPSEGTRLSRHLDSIDRTVGKAVELTRQLLAYAGKGSIHLKAVDLTHLVQEMVQILSVSIPKTVILECDPADRLPFIKGDGTQLLQLLMNLITNAAEAFGPGATGRITVRTRAEGFEAPPPGSDRWAVALAPGRYATLEIIDSGIGMAPELLERIFEPYYSTKRTGHGLGLAAVTGIIRAHGGALQVRSEPGHGSSFKVFLPAMKEDRASPDVETLPVWRDKGLILIAEEDPAVGDHARRLAEQHGLSVLEAGDGPAALGIFRDRHQDLALVLMGMAMPCLSGRDAFLKMKGIDARVPLLCNRGFDAPGPDRAAEGTVGLLRTPIRIAEFQVLLQRTLALRRFPSIGPEPIPSPPN